MFFSTNLPVSNSNTITNFASLTSKSSIFQAPTIHSTKTRNGIFADGTNYGKLHGSSLRRTSSNQRTLASQIYQERAERPLTAQNWRKNLSVNINEKELETGLRDYLGISQPFRPKTSTSKENTSIFQQRVGTSSSNKRGTLGISSVKSVKSILHIPSTFEVDGMLRRDLMCQTEEVDMNDFIDEKAQEKFQYIRFIKAPSKEFLKLLKLSNYDVTLVPSDSRRVVIEAILREFFLNLIPENSDYLICKNTQNQIYTILFTGRLVPTCKACSSVTRFEISSDLGFQVLCNSQYCNIKVLYQTKLNEKTRECLWPSNMRPDVEHSLPIRDAKRKPMISKLIQSGKYKNTDFSKVISNIHTLDLPQTRPNTTANVMRKVGSASTINRKIIKTSFTEKTSHLEGNQRPNTVQGLRRLGPRPDTAGSMSGSLDNKDFKGASILKEFDDKGLFAREIEEIGVIEQVSEEMSGEEEEEKENVPKKILEEMRQKEVRRPVPAAKKPVQKKKNERLTEKLEGYAIPRLSDHKNLFVGNKSSSKLDNSLEEIHNMVNILSK